MGYSTLIGDGLESIQRVVLFDVEISENRYMTCTFSWMRRCQYKLVEIQVDATIEWVMLL